jgi:hypothetical protein
MLSQVSSSTHAPLTCNQALEIAKQKDLSDKVGKIAFHALSVSMAVVGSALVLGAAAASIILIKHNFMPTMPPANLLFAGILFIPLTGGAVLTFFGLKFIKDMNEPQEREGIAPQKAQELIVNRAFTAPVEKANFCKASWFALTNEQLFEHFIQPVLDQNDLLKQRLKELVSVSRGGCITELQKIKNPQLEGALGGISPKTLLLEDAVKTVEANKKIDRYIKIWIGIFGGAALLGGAAFLTLSSLGFRYAIFIQDVGLTRITTRLFCYPLIAGVILAGISAGAAVTVCGNKGWKAHEKFNALIREGEFESPRDKARFLYQMRKFVEPNRYIDNLILPLLSKTITANEISPGKTNHDLVAEFIKGKDQEVLQELRTKTLELAPQMDERMRRLIQH